MTRALPLLTQDTKDLLRRLDRGMIGENVQCTFTARGSGERCQLNSLPFSHLCKMHGGNLQESRKVLREKLVEIAPKAAKALEEETEAELPGTKCIFCGRGMLRDGRTRIAASLAILDRAGVGPTSKIEVEHSLDTTWMRYLTDDELAQLIRLMESASSRRPAESATTREAQGSIIDAELVQRALQVADQQ